MAKIQVHSHFCRLVCWSFGSSCRSLEKLVLMALSVSRELTSVPAEDRRRHEQEDFGQILEKGEAGIHCAGLGSGPWSLPPASGLRVTACSLCPNSAFHRGRPKTVSSKTDQLSRGDAENLAQALHSQTLKDVLLRALPKSRCSFLEAAACTSSSGKL